MTPITYSELDLHANYYAPRGVAHTAVLLISPLFEEKRCAHRALVSCARALAQAGAATLLPDLYGTGNSAGELTEIGLDRWQLDLQAAVEELRARAGDMPLTILACRAGALLAAHAIADGLHPAQFILWQPVVSGRGYLSQLRTRRMIQDKITGDTPPETGEWEIEGQALSPALFASLQALSLPATMSAGMTLKLLQCSFNDKLLADYSRAILVAWGEERLRVRRLICEPFWNPHTPGDYTALAAGVVEEVLS